MTFLTNPYITLPPPALGFAFLQGGFDPSVGTSPFTSTDKYSYSNDTAASDITMTTPHDRNGASSTLTTGYFFAGIGPSGFTTAVTKVQWSNMAESSGTSFAANRFDSAAGGNSTVAIIGGTSGAGSTSTDKYTYSGDTRVAGGTFNVARDYPSVSAIATVAIFAAGADSGGNSLLTTTKYTFSGDTSAAATSLGTARFAPSGTGNTTVGIHAGGTTTAGALVGTSTEKYTYSGDTRAAGTALGRSETEMCATGDSLRGIFAGGQANTGTAPVATTDKYTYSGDTRIAGGNLSTARCGSPGASSSPGGF